MKKILLLVFILCLTKIYGQFSDRKIITACQTCGVYAVELTDLDGDKDLDVLAASNSDGRISWYRREENGNYSDQILISDQMPRMLSAKAFDIDGDGDQDVAAGSSLNKLVWFKNDGAGHFTEQIIVDNPFLFYGIFLSGDIDGDGDQDLIEHDFSYVYWYKNDGKGNFSQQIRLLSLIGNLSVLHLYDFDKDGDLDMVSNIATERSFSRKIAWFKNDGTGNFSEHTLDDSYDIDAVFPTDWDNDGKTDIVSIKRGKIELYRNKGNDTFGAPEPLANNEDYDKPIYTADLDKDGDQDIIVVSQGQRKIIWYPNDGKGNLSAPIEVYFDSTHDGYESGPIPLQIIDSDKDGNLDLLFGDYAKSQIFLLPNVGKFPNTQLRTINSNAADGAKSVFSVDLDQDGDQDLVFTATKNDKIGWYENQGAFQFKQHIIDTTQRFPFAAKAADLNQDGLVDVVATGRDNKILWYKNIGSNQFSPPVPFAINPFTNGVFQLGDIDNDQDIDLVQARSSSLLLLQNNGDGTFLESSLGDPGLDIYVIQLVDLEEDGDLDIIVSYFSQQGLYCSIYKNLGNGEFESPLKVANMPYVRDLVIGDFDGDGFKDLLARSLYTEGIVMAKNDQFNNFLPGIPLIGQLKNLEAIYGADVEGDGDLDLLAVINGELYWYAQNELGKFDDKILIFSKIDNKYALSLTGADLDNDGDIDLISTSEEDDEIAYYENRFNYPTIYGTVFLDSNSNGNFDVGEKPIPNYPLKLNNTNTTFTSNDGVFRFYVPEGLHELTPHLDSCWQLTTDSLKYSVRIVNGSTYSYNIGLNLNPKLEKIRPHLFSAATRCGFTVRFVLSVSNEGCNPKAGRVALLNSPLARFISASNFPDFINKDTLFWNFEPLIGNQIEQFNLDFEIAGTEFIGDTIHLKALVYTQNGQEPFRLVNTYDYRSEIRCAYDPNDKLTFPNRRNAYPRNYTLFKEEMEFLVRFQNTGNDTAFTVVIRDTLDKNLDWSTFRPLVGSHPFETHIQENGALSFTFKNILLPDSKTNEPLSHGFVSYRVSPKKGLPEQTEIKNTAYIYFDFNPPIQTNTTSNVMVSSLPRATRTKDINSSLDYKLYPNPFDNELLLESTSIKGPGEYTFALLNSQGQIVQFNKVVANIERIKTQHLPSGLYFYFIKNTQGSVVASGKVVCR